LNSKGVYNVYYDIDFSQTCHSGHLSVDITNNKEYLSTAALTEPNLTHHHCKNSNYALIILDLEFNALT